MSQEIESLTTPDELNCLRKWAKGKKTLVEVGVCYGGTSVELRKVMDPNGTLYLVDPFIKLPMTWKGQSITDDFEIAQKNLATQTNGNIVWCRDMSKNVAETFDKKVDFVFIDGNHAAPYPQIDWESWYPHVELDGIISFHDVSSPHPGVLQAYEIVKKNTKFKEIEAVGSVRVLQRIEE